VLNISDTFYEKLRFESINEKKSVQQLLAERLMNKCFDNNVEEAFQAWMNQEINKIIGE